MIKSLLELQSALIESLNKPTVNEFRIPRPTMEPQQNEHLQTNLNIEHGENICW